jgi:nicotinamidase-related amidase
VLPKVVKLVEHAPERTVFTRFITPRRPEEMHGMWRPYYEKWHQTTLEEMDAAMLDLVPPLGNFVPPATVVDKKVYGGFSEPALHAHLQSRAADALVISGSETDVCVASTVLGAVDKGYRVILVRDAVCSSSDAGHDALLEVYHRRYGQQIETADSDEIIAAWSK